jgi:hypothetical protein
MNSRAVTLFVLSAAWIALGVPCAAEASWKARKQALQGDSAATAP